MVFNLIRLALINRLGRSAVTQPGGPVVSLTTYGKRIHTVYLAIESIANGTMRPSRLILWIDDEALLNNLPDPIRRLQRRGLEVERCRNYGPHKKYYPYVESQERFDVPLVTADDDMLYPRYWLKKLVEANREYPDMLNAFWVRVIRVTDAGIGRYADFEPCSSMVPSFRHLSLNGAGTIFPAALLHELKRAGTAFETCCPRGDDLWLHVRALRSGYKVRQVYPRLPYFSFNMIPGSQSAALSSENVTLGDGNDRQIRATYTQADLQVLRAEAGSAHQEQIPNGPKLPVNENHKKSTSPRDTAEGASILEPH